MVASAALTRVADVGARVGHGETGVTAYRDAAVLSMRSMDYAAARRALEAASSTPTRSSSRTAPTSWRRRGELDWADGRLGRGRATAAGHGRPRLPAAADDGPLALGYVAIRARRRSTSARGPRGGVGVRRTERDDRVGGPAAAAGGWPSWPSSPATPRRPSRIARRRSRSPRGRRTAVVRAVRGDRRPRLPGRRATRAMPSAGSRRDAAIWLRPRVRAARRSTTAEGLVALAAGSTGVARDLLEAAVDGWDAARPDLGGDVGPARPRPGAWSAPTGSRRPSRSRRRARDGSAPGEPSWSPARRAR